MKLLMIGSIGLIVLSIVTIGFAASLTTAPVFNLIGASDNNSVNAARGNLTDVSWTTQISGSGVSEVTRITFTVGNEDTSAHSFQICATMKGTNGVISPASGNSPECVTTPTINATSKLTNQNISFSTPLDVTLLNDFNFSIEELN